MPGVQHPIYCCPVCGARVSIGRWKGIASLAAIVLIGWAIAFSFYHLNK